MEVAWPNKVAYAKGGRLGPRPTDPINGSFMRLVLAVGCRTDKGWDSWSFQVRDQSTGCDRSSDVADAGRGAGSWYYSS